MEWNISTVLRVSVVCTHRYVNSYDYSYNNFYRPKIGACEMSVFVYLPMAFLSKKIPYKYVIYSAPLSNGMWEYIHDLPAHGTFNRCLELDKSSSTRKFSYLQYMCMYFTSLCRKIIPCVWWFCVSSWNVVGED